MNAIDTAHTVTGFPEEETILPVSSIDVRVLPGPHPLYVANEAEIAANWEREVAANPALFNGKLVFLSALSLDGDRVSARGHLVPYSTHLWWRRQKGRTGGYHCFCWAVPISSDGAVIAIRMGPQTANPGLVYCAAGSLEEDDIVGDAVDLHANMEREVREETGLDLAGAVAEPDRFYSIFREETLMSFRFYRFRQTAEEMLATVREHMRHDPEQEIDDVVAIRDSRADAYRYSRFMPPLLRLVFDEGL